MLRGVETDADLVPLQLKKGTNRLLLKVQNAEAGLGIRLQSSRQPGSGRKGGSTVL